MIDSHTHLYDPAYDPDREQVILRAQEAGLKAIVVIGCDLESSRMAVDLADRHDFLYATIGVHPHEVKAINDHTYPELQKLASHPKVVGYGETGLDYYYRHSPMEVQQRHFRAQIQLAKSLRLPLVVHSRNARQDTIKILQEESAASVGGVLHCFTGDLEMARAAVGMNFFISFSGILTFDNAQDLREVARALPQDRILIETDCPYLTPIPHRGRRNEPAYLHYTARALAGLYPSQSPEQLLKKTVENTGRLFRIKL